VMYLGATRLMGGLLRPCTPPQVIWASAIDLMALRSVMLHRTMRGTSFAPKPAKPGISEGTCK
jgi:hypothetical protein